MLDISVELENELQQTITHPVLLLEIQYDTPDEAVIRSSSADDRIYLGNLFSGSNPDFRAQANTQEELRLQFPLPSSATRYYSLAMNPADGGTKVKLWQVYGSESTVPENKAVLRFDGFVTGVPQCSEELIEYQCRASHFSALWTPRIIIAAPVFNHLPEDGTKVGNIELNRR